MNRTKSQLGAAFLWLALPSIVVGAPKGTYAYIGDLGPDHVLIAWGTTGGENTIGRTAKSIGPATVKIDGKEIAVNDKNWTVISGLKPDTDYPYEVLVNGRSIGQSKVRTWPEKSENLRFFVIGDYGSGDAAQQSVAELMVKEFQRLDGNNPVRFVITTGDNIYGKLGFALRFNSTGDKDSHWQTRFFQPYEALISRIPFYPSLGNHDGNETENRADLPQYLDNFFFPSHQPSRYYRFSYGGLADFFALDSSANSEAGPPKAAYAPNSDQHTWLMQNLADSKTPWKIPYMHHPPFNAGPRHPAAARELAHFLQVFQKNGVKVVFSGHEHNFQFSKLNRETEGIRYIVSGSGGELRHGDVRGSMDQSQIEGWAAVLQFLLVEISNREMRITPLSPNRFEVVSKDGKKIDLPLRVTLD